jgi:hypothetical protein
VDQDESGFKITFRLTSKIPSELWKTASSYMRGYARRSHWALDELSQKRGHVALHIKYSPPKPQEHGKGRGSSHRAPHPISRRISK